MNILLINHHAGGPAWGMEHRPHALAREWIKLGHEVTIAAASQSYLRTVQPETTGAITTEACDGIKYRWYQTPVDKEQAMDRLLHMRLFLRAVAADSEYLASTPKPDAVIASSTYPMDVKVAKQVARASGAILVHEVHELWSDVAVEVAGMSRLNPHLLRGRSAERAAYRDADLVITMLPKAHAHMQARGLDPIKLHVVPSGVAPEAWTSQSKEPLRSDVTAAVERVRKKGYTLIGYHGPIGRADALDPLIDAADMLRGERFAFIVVGDGPERERLRQRAKDAKLATVIFLPSIASTQVPALLASLDMIYVGWKRAPVYRSGIASDKLMNSMMGACAIIHAVDAGNDPVREAECGLSVAPEDPTALARAVRQMALMSRRERVAMGMRGQAYALAHHSYPVLAQRFVDAMAQTMLRRKDVDD